MNTVLAIVGGVALSAALASPHNASANMLINPSLETSLAPDQYNMISASPTQNAAALNGWTITSGSIDIIPNTYWQSTAGTYSVDLIGSPGVGSIAQTLATVIGETYELTFDFAVNPQNLTGEIGSTKRLLVTATAANSAVDGSQTFSRTAGTGTLLNLQYAEQTMLFTASSTSTTLTFAALMPTGLPGSYTSGSVFSGPIIDNLDLVVFGSGTPTPEPASVAVLGLGAVVLLRRRSRGRG